LKEELTPRKPEGSALQSNSFEFLLILSVKPQTFSGLRNDNLELYLPTFTGTSSVKLVVELLSSSSL
jgi:cadmium resistance protein CadD (predicted permease)